MDSMEVKAQNKNFARLLIVDDEEHIRRLIITSLKHEGYNSIFYEAENGLMAWDILNKEQIDLVILDYRMPQLNGIDVLKRIKSNLLLCHIPIIMLSGRNEIEDKVDGLSAGADDYITKPFEPKELVARIQMILKRTEGRLEANPVTHLPGNVPIQNEILRRIEKKDLFAVCYLDINNFKSYNDIYGFEGGDLIIKETARIMVKVREKFGNPEDFVGHIGGDDFLFITRIESVDTICREIIKDFESVVPVFYSENVLQKGFIVAIDREGKAQRVPLLSIVICVVTNESRTFSDISEIANVAVELTAFAKGFEKNVYIVDQRIK